MAVTVISASILHDVCSKYYIHVIILFPCPMDAIARCPLLVAVFLMKLF